MAVRTRPAGGLLGAQGLFRLTETLSLGAYLDYFYYWAEMGAKLEWTVLGGFLKSSFWLGVEPGEFIPATEASNDRSPGLRAVARARAELNFRIQRLWLYNRLTLEGRVRTFEERDPFRAAILGTELSVEEAFAPLFALVKWGRRSALWIYAEITVAAEVRFGVLDLRPSAGFIVEELFEGFTMDLDLYYSLRTDTDIGGFGALVFVWWRF